MRHISILIFTAACSTIFACSTSNKNSTQDNTEKDHTIHSGNGEALTSQDKKTNLDLLSKYWHTPEDVISKGEQNYFLSSMYFDNKVMTRADSLWYRKNIAHVDSISHNAYALLLYDRYIDLQNLFEDEIHNFEAHPLTDSDLMINLNVLLTQLYILNISDKKELNEKIVSQWEVVRHYIEVVQATQGIFIPQYEAILITLLGAYRQFANEEKIKEISFLLDFMNGDIPLDEDDE